MISVVDYGAGNIRSMCDALNRLGASYTVTSDAGVISSADRVIIPGVGEASSAMSSLRSRGLDKIIKDLRVPVLGVCIGMQLMCRHSEEGDAECLDIIDTNVCRLSDPDGKIKIPHMGWNTITDLSGPLFEGIDDSAWVYYVHTFAADICGSTIARTEYGRKFSAALQRNNFFGVQFHPEKSAAAGERIISNFLKLQL